MIRLSSDSDYQAAPMVVLTVGREIPVSWILPHAGDLVTLLFTNVPPQVKIRVLSVGILASSLDCLCSVIQRRNFI